jgi:hypothetical protein
MFATKFVAVNGRRSNFRFQISSGNRPLPVAQIQGGKNVHRLLAAGAIVGARGCGLDVVLLVKADDLVVRGFLEDVALGAGLQLLGLEFGVLEDILTLH